MKKYNPFFAAVKLFQKTFGHPAPDQPVALTPERSLERMSYTGEELVEFLHAAVGGDPKKFVEITDKFVAAIDYAVDKQLQEGEYTNKTNEEVLTRQYDATIDMLYFVMGTFVELGMDPTPGFDVVQAANMGKLGEDGKPIIRESDNKIMKPEGWEEKFAPEPKLREIVKKALA